MVVAQYDICEPIRTALGNEGTVKCWQDFGCVEKRTICITWIVNGHPYGYEMPDTDLQFNPVDALAKMVRALRFARKIHEAADQYG